MRRSRVFVNKDYFKTCNATFLSLAILFPAASFFERPLVQFDMIEIFQEGDAVLRDKPNQFF